MSNIDKIRFYYKCKYQNFLIQCISATVHHIMCKDSFLIIMLMMFALQTFETLQFQQINFACENIPLIMMLLMNVYIAELGCPTIFSARIIEDDNNNEEIEEENKNNNE